MIHMLTNDDFGPKGSGVCGLLVQHKGGETYIISWRNCANSDSLGSSKNGAKWGLTSLRDGMVLGWWTQAELLAKLAASEGGVYDYQVLAHVNREVPHVATNAEKLVLRA